MPHKNSKNEAKKKRLEEKKIKAEKAKKIQPKQNKKSAHSQKPQATRAESSLGVIDNLEFDSVDLDSVDAEQQNTAVMDKATKDSGSKEYRSVQKSISYVENLAHILPYELVYRGLESKDYPHLKSKGIDGIVGEQAIVDDDGVERMYYVKRVQTAAGISCFVLFSPDAQNSSVKILFRGTADIEGGIRDGETLGTCPGGDSFKLHEDKIMEALTQVVSYKVEQGCNNVCLDDAGHSLGGADSQLAAELILRKMAENPDDSALSAITKLRIMHANAAGTSNNINKSAEESLQKLHEQSRKKGTARLEVEQQLIQVGGDIVQQTGECYLFSKTEPSKVRTKVFRFDMLEGTRNPIEPHSALFAGKADEVGSSFDFTLLDTNDPEERKTIQQMLSFKWPRVIAIKDYCLLSLEILKKYRKVAPYIGRFIDNLDDVFAASLIRPYVPMHPTNFAILTEDFHAVSGEYLKKINSGMQYTKYGMDYVSNIVPMVDTGKKNLKFFADVASCLHSYYEYQTYLTPWERKVCQMGLTLVIIAAILIMSPTIAPGIMPAHSATAMNSLCGALINEGSYLCKIGLRRYKNLEAHSILFENIDKYAQSLSAQEQEEVHKIGAQEHVKRALYFALDAKKQDIENYVAKMTENIQDLKDLVSNMISGGMSSDEFTSQARDKVNELIKPIKAVIKICNNPVAIEFLSSAQILLEKTKSSSPKVVQDAVSLFLTVAKRLIPSQIAEAEKDLPESSLQQVAKPLYDSLDVMDAELKSDQKLPAGSKLSLPDTIPGLVTIMAGLSGMMTNITELRTNSVFEGISTLGAEMFKIARPTAEQKTKAQKK